jgi:predicted nicotinamide N-methyase
MDIIASRYDLAQEEVNIGVRTFTMTVVRDPDVLLERVTPAQFAQDERLPYWAELWTSSLALARFCLEEIDFRGKRVLELGCGVGLVGLSAASGGAHVVMSDYEHDALLFSQYNALVNLTPAVVRKRIHFRHLDWRAPGLMGQYDAVLGADILYERSLHGPLLRVLDEALAPGGRVVLTDPERPMAREFVAAAHERDYSCDAQTSSWRRRGRVSTVTRYMLRRSP